MMKEMVFPNGHIPFHLNESESLNPSAILLAIDACDKRNKFAVDVIYALVSQVDKLSDQIKSLEREKKSCRVPISAQIPAKEGG